MASRYVVGEEGSQCLEEDVSSEPRTENVARDEAQLELHRVVFHGDLASAKAALERGASVSVQDRFGESGDSYWCTGCVTTQWNMHWAQNATSLSDIMCIALLNCGFLLCVGNTPLHIAVMLGHKGK